MTFKAHPKAGSRRESATKLIKLLLENNDPSISEHVRDLIDTLLWRITEADGKYKTVYWTEGAVGCADKSQLRHEHVCQRSKMIEALVNAKPDEWDGILKNAVGCVVTVEEHKLLGKHEGEYGWERYRKAGIVVLDTSAHPPTPVKLSQFLPFRATPL